MSAPRFAEDGGSPICACLGCEEQLAEIIEVTRTQELWRCDCGHVTSVPRSYPHHDNHPELLSEEQLKRLAQGLSV